MPGGYGLYAYHLGVALALVCKVKGYPCTCITAPNANPAHLTHIRRYGNDGFLQTRLRVLLPGARPPYYYRRRG